MLRFVIQKVWFAFSVNKWREKARLGSELTTRELWKESRPEIMGIYIAGATINIFERNYGAPKNWCFWTVDLEKTLQSPLDSKEIQPVHPKGDQSCVHWKDWWWSWNSNTLATSCEELAHWKRPWCWEGLRAGGEGDDRGWDGWMASPTQWMWVWVNSGSLWWTGRPGMLWFMGSQRVRHDWAAELNWIFHCVYVPHLLYPFICRWTFRLCPCPVYCK